MWMWMGKVVFTFFFHFIEAFETSLESSIIFFLINFCRACKACNAARRESSTDCRRKRNTSGTYEWVKTTWQVWNLDGSFDFKTNFYWYKEDSPHQHFFHFHAEKLLNISDDLILNLLSVAIFLTKPQFCFEKKLCWSISCYKVCMHARFEAFLLSISQDIAVSAY